MAEYTIQNQKIYLDLNEKVFQPSLHGSSALGESIRIKQGESVLDLGTGTGLLAILSAKLGGVVTATDILPEAVELAKINSKKNGISIDIRLSNLFDAIKPTQTFDVIIANVPQENLSPKLLSSLPPEVITGMHGGINGNEILQKVLQKAPPHMHSKSRMYVVVYSMSNFRTSLKNIMEIYNGELINFHTGPVKDFVYNDVEWYEHQSKDGLISIYRKKNKYFADLFVFELRLK